MDVVKEVWKNKYVIKRIRSMSTGSNKKCSAPLANSKSYQCLTESTQKDKRKTMNQVAPEGCFSVYVGPQRQRFVIKIEFVNHPLFKLLLEDAELEYGYNSEGPMLLPCQVDLFVEVLAEIADSDDDEISPGCSFVKGYGSFSIFSPSSRSLSFTNGKMIKGYGSFSLLSPSRFFKMNHF